MDDLRPCFLQHFILLICPAFSRSNHSGTATNARTAESAVRGRDRSRR